MTDTQYKVGETFVRAFTGLFVLILYVAFSAAGMNRAAALFLALYIMNAEHFTDDSTSLVDNNYDFANPNTSIERVAAAATLALKDSNFTLPEGMTNFDVMKIIIDALMDNMDSAELLQEELATRVLLLGSLVGSLMAISNEIDFSSVSDVRVELTKEAFSKISAAGFTSARDLSLAAGEMMLKAVGNLDESGLSDKDTIQSTAKSMMNESIQALSLSGFSNSEVSEISKTILEKGIIGLNNTGLSQEDTKDSIEFLTEGLMEGLSNAGYSSSELEDIQNDIGDAIDEGLSEIGFDQDDIDEAQDDANDILNDLLP